MAPARLEFLGGFCLTSGAGSPVEVTAKKNRALLAILAMAPRLETTRDRLAGLLWSDRGEEQARSSLRQGLTSLNRDLAGLDADPLVLVGDRVALDAKQISIDVMDFLAVSASSDPTELEHAAYLYKGSFADGINIADNAFDEWLREARADLSARAINVLETLSASLEGAERVAVAERLVALEPLREASHLTLMRTHVDQSQTALAIKQYEACKLLLKRELGVEPGEELQQLRRTLDAWSVRQIRRGEAETGRVSDQPRTRIALLPFDNLSGDHQQDHFIDGLVEDLVTELSRFRHLSITTMYSALSYKGRQIQAQEVGRQLEVDFIVRGAVRLLGGHLRITAQLIDTETDAHVWAERFDRTMEDVFTVQDEVVESILATLTFNLDEAVGEKRRRNPTTSATAYTHFLQARADWRSGDEPGARKQLIEALKIDPSYARAHAYLAFMYGYSLCSLTASMPQSETRNLTREHLRQAIAIDSGDPFVMHRAAMAYTLLGDHEAGRRFAEQAVALNPRDIEALVVHGCVLTLSGQAEAGLALLEQATRDEPRLPPGFRVSLCEGRYLTRDYAGALRALEPIVDATAYVNLMRAACFAQLGQVNIAKNLVEKTLLTAPEGFDPVLFAQTCAAECSSPKDVEHWLEGFRKAGLGV